MIRMLKYFKRHINLFAICSATAICMGVVLASCSADDVVDYTDDKVSDNETVSYYMAIKLYDAADNTSFGTRASFDSDFDGDIFNKGLNEEKAIYANYENGMPNFIMLFDENDEKVGDLLHLKPFLPEDTENPEQESDNSSYSLFVATLNENDVLRKDISKVLVVLNASPSVRVKLNAAKDYDAAVKTIKMSDEDVIARSSYADATKFLYLNADGKQYFTMSSSMVVKGGSVDAATDRSTLKEHLHKTKAEALEDPFAMYVERTQSKYTVLFKKKSDSDNLYYFDSSENTKSSGNSKYVPVGFLEYESGKDFPLEGNLEELRYVDSYVRSESVSDRKNVSVITGSWKVNITGWSVNGLEKNEYLFKKIEPTTTYFTNWQTLPYRNYWAESYHYSDGTYPDQYRKVFTLENGSLTNLENLESLEQLQDQNQDPTLNYFPFSTLNQKEPHQYSPENTFSTDVFRKNGNTENATEEELTEAFDSKAFLRVGTHLIVTAQLLIKGFDDAYAVTSYNSETGLVTGVADKLCMDGIYWSKKAYMEYVAEYLAYWMLTDDNQGIFGSNDGNFYVGSGGSYRLAKGTDFDLKPAQIKGGDGWVYLSPDDGVTLYTKTTDKEGKDNYSPIDPDKYETLAYEHQELMAGHFKDGCMYYAVPVEHNNAGLPKTTIATGDYGAVRNHWYAFTVNQIFSVGTPVDDPDQPIVPNLEPKNPGLGVEVKILNWHQVSTDVDISGQRPGK
ncbi:MAG: Mfa1 fimbrilin C-terminal domain-containing protein [Prevotellaceae bacterium]|nr:Mfa1 fimbrilin C-terminal domain-containing protein [Prevotellaceae bacterium]